MSRIKGKNTNPKIWVRKLFTCNFGFYKPKNSMQVWLEINDNKAAFFMELIRNLSFVKTKTMTPQNELFLTELQEAVEEANLVKEGKTEYSSARDFLNEL